MRIIEACFVFLLIVAVSGLTTRAQRSPDAGLRAVKVYFMFIGKDGTESKILPLTRKVSAAAPLFPAIEALLAEPTAAEQALGYYSAGYGDMKLVSIKLLKGSARVDFSRELRADFNPGDLQSLGFESAVIKTAKQFPSIRKVVVCVNGMNEFGVGMTIDQPIPCPKTR